MLLFDGEGPDAKFAGVSYSMSGATDTAPIFAHDHPELFDGFLPQRDA